MTSPVTAVGRILQPTHGEPRILHRIRRNPATGKFSTITRLILNGPRPNPR